MGNIQQYNVIHVKHGNAGKFFGKVRLSLLFVLMLLSLSACTSGANLLGSGSWQASTLTTQHIQALAVDPVTPQKLYAGNEDGTLFTSSDGGQHWITRTRISPTRIKLLMLTLPPSGKTLYALTANGLFASTDAAQTWQVINTSRSGLPVDSYTTMTFNAQKSIYIGTLHHGVFASDTSDGVHWHFISGTLPSTIAINELAFDSTQHRLWAATSLGVYLSENEGVTWNALNSGLPVTGGVLSLQPAASSGGATNLVYAGTQQGIFRSMDAGGHWTESGPVLQGVPIEHILIDYRSTNASTLYVGTRFGVFRSDDSGQNWFGAAASFPRSTSVYALVIGADNASQLYAAANNVYIFPGYGSSITPTRVITLLLTLLLFVLLALIAQRSMRRRKRLFRPRSSPEASSSTKN